MKFTLLTLSTGAVAAITAVVAVHVWRRLNEDLACTHEGPVTLIKVPGSTHGM